MIQSQDFLEGKGLSNEVNIRILCYEPRDEMAVRHFIEQLSTDMTLGCQLRICNLYQIFLGICEGMDILDAIPDMEDAPFAERIFRLYKEVAVADIQYLYII